MSLNQIRQLTLALAPVVCLFAAANLHAGQGKHFDQTGMICCPVCDHVCKLDTKEVEIEKTCFKVEPKVVCIPRVVFPWQKARKAACAACTACNGKGCTACVQNGARLRRVCVLKTEKYKCPACEYTWSAEKKGTCGLCQRAGCNGEYCDGHPRTGTESKTESILPPGPAAPDTAQSQSVTTPQRDYYRTADGFGFPVNRRRVVAEGMR